MDKQKAKEILALYRPGLPDIADAEMAEALEMMKTDAELARWFEEHCAVYLAIRKKLKQVEPPADLKRKILLENVGRAKVVPLRSPVPLLAMAAGIMILGAGLWALLTPRVQDTFPGYRDRMARSVQRHGYPMDMVSTNLTEIRQFLHDKHADADYRLSKGLEKTAGVGCAALYWHGKRVSMVCFKDTENKDLYLFVANRADIQNAPVSEKPQFAPIHRLLTASWASGDRVYVLAGKGDEAYLQKYLQ